MIPQQSSSTTNPHGLLQGAHGRRTFLVAGGLGFCGVPLADRLVAQAPDSAAAAPAKSTILIWLSGGASHIDTWDMKPAAPVEFRGPFQSQATSAPAIQLCEHLPQLARRETSCGHHVIYDDVPQVLVYLGALGRGDDALELRRRQEQQLQRIANAFKRMDKGTYGSCGKCKQPISEDRLDVSPDVVMCVRCA